MYNKWPETYFVIGDGEVGGREEFIDYMLGQKKISLDVTYDDTAGKRGKNSKHQKMQWFQNYQLHFI